MYDARTVATLTHVAIIRFATDLTTLVVLVQAAEIVCAIAFDAVTTPWLEADTILDMDFATVTALEHVALMVIRNAL